MVKSKFYNLFLTLFALVFLVGCNSHKKFVKYANTHKEELAELCAEEFVPVVRLIEGRRDTVSIIEYSEPDSIPCPPVETLKGEILVKYVKCPPAKFITNTVSRVDTIIKPDAPKEFLLQSKLTKAEKNLKEKTESRNKWRSTAIIAIIAGVALLFLVIGRR